MNKIFKIIGWVLGLVGTVIGVWALFTNGANADLLLRYTYVLFFAAVVVWIGLAIYMVCANNPKDLIKVGLVIVGIAALILVAYVLSSGAPALNVRTQPSASILKMTDTMLLLTYILGGAAIVTVIFAAIRNAINNK